MTATDYYLQTAVEVEVCLYFSVGECSYSDCWTYAFTEDWRSVEPSPPPLPTVDGLSPSSGSGWSQTFTAQYSSAQGPAWVYWMGISVGGGCYLGYMPSNQTLHLNIDDAWSGWHTAQLGSGTVLQNSRCSVPAATTTAGATGSQWTFTVPVTFASSWTDTHQVQLVATNSLSGIHMRWTHPEIAGQVVTVIQAGTPGGTPPSETVIYYQAREFDEHGNAVRDIDFTDHGRPNVPGHTNPHEHLYQPNPSGGSPIRGPARPLP